MNSKVHPRRKFHRYHRLHRRHHHDGLLARYPKAVVGDFDGDPARVTEMDAMVAYLQMLGTLVDFADVDPASLEQ